MEAPRPAPPADSDLQFKFVLAGDSRVGKSAVIARIADDTFTDRFVSTIGVEFRLHRTRLGGKTVKLQLWDTAGNARFRTISSAYYRGAKVAGIMYDATNRESFEHCQVWFDEVLRSMHSVRPDSVDTRHRPLVLVACKIDAPVKEHRVSAAEGSALAASWNVSFVEVSACTGENLHQLVTHMTKIAIWNIEGRGV